MKITQYQSADKKNDHEWLGISQDSITSAIITAAYILKDKHSVMHFKKEIDSFTATLWSLLPLALEKSLGNKKEGEMFEVMLKQLKLHTESFCEQMVALSEITPDGDDNE